MHVTNNKYYCSEEFFYQTVINQIGKFGKILLSTPTSIQSCISLRMPTAAPQEIHTASLSILAHQELLKSYYQLEVVVVTADDDEEVDVCVTCLPMILKNYVPTLDKLPEFLFNIATEVSIHVFA
jgi:DNA mismatch repair protein MLH1